MNDNRTLFKNKKEKHIEILAKSDNNFQIELLKESNNNDLKKIYAFLNTNREEISFNSSLLLNDIKKYFTYPKTLPFLARLNNDPIAYIIGMKIEDINEKHLLPKENNWGKGNTVYLFSHEINSKYSKRNYENILIKIAINWLLKNGYEYICGYEKKGMAEKIFQGCIIISRVENWNESGEVYEYYKLSL